MQCIVLFIDVKSFDVICREMSISQIAIVPSGYNCSAVESLCFSLSMSLYLRGTSVGSTWLLWRRFSRFSSQSLLSSVMRVLLAHHPHHSSVFLALSSFPSSMSCRVNLTLSLCSFSLVSHFRSVSPVYE